MQRLRCNKHVILLRIFILILLPGPEGLEAGEVEKCIPPPRQASVSLHGLVRFYFPSLRGFLRARRFCLYMLARACSSPRRPAWLQPSEACDTQPSRSFST